MMRVLLFAIVVVLFSSCSPNIYKVYEKYEQDPNFEQTKLDVSLLQLGGLFVSKDQKSVRSLLKAINSVDIVQYKGGENTVFQKEVLRSLKSGNYREVLEDKTTIEDAKFFIKKGLTNVKEFHVLNYEKGDVYLVSIDGKFNMWDLEKVYKLIKKQQNMSGIIKNIDLQLNK